jgi:hypothetical protein
MSDQCAAACKNEDEGMSDTLVLGKDNDCAEIRLWVLDNNVRELHY